MKLLTILLQCALIAASINLVSCQEQTKQESTLITPEELHTEKDNYVIVDVRTPQEISQGKIEGALELNYFDEDFEAEILKLDKSKSYVMYCRSGNRSGKAQDFMLSNGFEKVLNLAGGYNSYQKILDANRSNQE